MEVEYVTLYNRRLVQLWIAGPHAAGVESTALVASLSLPWSFSRERLRNAAVTAASSSAEVLGATATASSAGSSGCATNPRTSKIRRRMDRP